MNDCVIVTTDRFSFFAARMGKNEYGEGYHVYELDPNQSAERNHYIVTADKIHEIVWGE
jgi:hypothetical protein